MRVSNNVQEAQVRPYLPSTSDLRESKGTLSTRSKEDNVFSLSLSLSLTHTHTHSLSLSLSLSLSHTHTHTQGIGSLGKMMGSGKIRVQKKEVKLLNSKVSLVS